MDTKDLIERLKIDVLWHFRRGDKIIAKDCQDAADALEAMSKDAERYRWMRENPSWIGWDEDFLPTHVDVAIDAAIAKDAK